MKTAATSWSPHWRFLKKNHWWGTKYPYWSVLIDEEQSILTGLYSLMRNKVSLLVCTHWWGTKYPYWSVLIDEEQSILTGLYSLIRNKVSLLVCTHWWGLKGVIAGSLFWLCARVSRAWSWCLSEWEAIAALKVPPWFSLVGVHLSPHVQGSSRHIVTCPGSTRTHRLVVYYSSPAWPLHLRSTGSRHIVLAENFLCESTRSFSRCFMCTGRMPVMC